MPGVFDFRVLMMALMPHFVIFHSGLTVGGGVGLMSSSASIIEQVCLHS